jgi:cytochrome c
MSSRHNRNVALSVAAVALIGCGAAAAAKYKEAQDQLTQKAEILTGGNVERGKLAFAHYGCGGCHTVGGVPQANGKIGPPLDGIASRTMIAGRLENKPTNLRQWIMHPQQVSPGTAMPNLNVTQGDARDLSAFLYTRG